MESYKNKIVVAPMVRVSTLPFRLLCLDYGADLVYTEETIDFKMLRSIKVENDLLKTIDFVDKSDGTVFFRTCKEEKNKLIFQIGTCDSLRALKVAKMVEEYVAGIDINMGCPKEFSIKGGMGAALLTQPQKIKEILTNLSKNLSVPVTCKIRLLSTLEDTVALCKEIELCGVSAIAIHGRTRYERSAHPNHNDLIKLVAAQLSIPVIANGGSKQMNCREDIIQFINVTGADSVMVARAAMWNCSILRKDGKLPIDEVIEKYLRYCIIYDNTFTFTKYAVQNMLREMQSTGRGRAFLETQTLQEMSSLWNLQTFFFDQMKERGSSIAINRKSCAPQSIIDIKVVESIDSTGMKCIEMPLQFLRGNYAVANVPKMVLYVHVTKNNIEGLNYNCWTEDKLFLAKVEFQGIKYGSLIREKSKRYAEQGAALVCLHQIGLVDNSYGFVPAEGTRKYKQFQKFDILPTIKRSAEDSQQQSENKKLSLKDT